MSQIEILFKAKRIDTGEWVEGYPFPSIVGKELNRMSVFEPFPGGTVVNTYEIDPQTVCQYTGLTDKNGKKIFEGDIFKITSGCSPERDEVVTWEEEYAGFFPFADYDAESAICTNSKDGIVTGNIHDN